MLYRPSGFGQGRMQSSKSRSEVMFFGFWNVALAASRSAHRLYTRLTISTAMCLECVLPNKHSDTILRKSGQTAT